MSQPTIDCLAAVHENSKKLAAAAMKWGRENGKTPEEVIELILNTALGNELVDEELEENVIVGLARTFDVPVENVQYELNGGGEDADDE